MKDKIKIIDGAFIIIVNKMYFQGLSSFSEIPTQKK